MSIFGIGTDIVEIARFSSGDKANERLAKRVLTDFEMACFDAHKQPERYLAKRFAAKEAVVKAAGTGIGAGIGFQQLEVRNRASGQPYLTFYGAFSQWCQDNHISAAHLTISDEKHYAVATVILEVD